MPDPDHAFYHVRLETPGASTLVQDVRRTYRVHSFAITPDSNALVYLEHHDFSFEDEFINELYRVQFATPGMQTKLNGPLVIGGDVHSFQVR